MGIICIQIGNIVRTMLGISYLYMVRKIYKLPIIVVLQEITIQGLFKQFKLYYCTHDKNYNISNPI